MSYRHLIGEPVLTEAQVENHILAIAKKITENEEQGSCASLAACDSRHCVERRLLAVEQIHLYLVDSLAAIAAQEVREKYYR
jgi:hypothetical protein